MKWYVFSEFIACMTVLFYFLCWQDGAYLVRNSETGGEKAPYTLNVLYKNKVRNLQMRRLDDGRFALGKEKPNEVVCI